MVGGSAGTVHGHPAVGLQPPVTCRAESRRLTHLAALLLVSVVNDPGCPRGHCYISVSFLLRYQGSEEHLKPTGNGQSLKQ